MRPTIDTLYIYRQSGKATTGMFEKLNQRHIEGQSYRFMRGETLDQSDSVYRYAQTVKIIPKDKNIQPQYRTFLIITMDKRKTAISKFFARAKQEVQNRPDLTQVAMLADSEPVNMQIGYSGS